MFYFFPLQPFNFLIKDSHFTQKKIRFDDVCWISVDWLLELLLFESVSPLKKMGNSSFFSKQIFPSLPSSSPYVINHKSSSICRKEKEDENKLSQQSLRLKILNDLSFSFPFYTIIILYFPPLFSSSNIIQFISLKINLIIIDLNQLLIQDFNYNNNNNSHNSINNNKHNNNNSHNNNNNNQKSYLRREEEERTQREVFEKSIKHSHSQNGFISINYPLTPLQLRYLRQFLPNGKLIPIFFDLDTEVCISFYIHLSLLVL